jgi:TonB family protein
MIQLGVREGKALVAVSVNSQGRVEDCLAVAYTHPAFGRAAVVALKRWTFEPARFAGEAVPAMTEVTVNFEVEGTTVISMTTADTLAAWFHALNPSETVSRPRVLRELDCIPTPITAVAPRYPVELAQKGRHGIVTVQFYIDETGAVRFPCVNATQDVELATLALAAVQQWKFEPPTCQGRAVLVKAEQVFNFNPAKAADATAAAGKS